MTLQEVIARFNTTPFLFAGSGITRRYYNLPNWEELLKHFAQVINKDRFAYRSYVSRANGIEHPNGVLPMVASLIQTDFEAAWYANEAIRTLDEEGLAMVERGVSPFKAEVAAYIARQSVIDPVYKGEIAKLKNIAKKNLAGVITTNYDTFFDKVFSEYKVYVGQDDLIFSAIQGVAEIYKIHGSTTHPDSQVINNDDYQLFNDNGKYLAAKLMTIFMEYPIIFIGYSLTDENIRQILSDIVLCLPNDKFERLQERFVFVEYRSEEKEISVVAHSINLGSRMLNMTKISMSDFGVLYDALTAKKASIPVKILRRFKEEIYSYVVTSKPGPILQVASLDDARLDDNLLAISIGTTKASEYGLKSIIDADIWYRDIITDEIKDLGFTFDQVLDNAFATAFKGANGLLPVHKALFYAKNPHNDVTIRAAQSYDSIASKTIRNSRKSVQSYSSPLELWEKEKSDFKKATRLLGYMPEEKMPVEELEIILREIFKGDSEILSHITPNEKTDIRRLIRFYDYLRWGKNKDPQN